MRIFGETHSAERTRQSARGKKKERVLKENVSDKARVRRMALERRDNLPLSDRIEFSLKIREHGAKLEELRQVCARGGTVAGFLPIKSEIDPRPLMSALSALGARLCLPMIRGGSKERLEFRAFEREAKLIPGPFGTLEPDEDAARAEPDALLTPLSAYDRRGGRIGYGGGYYDRFVSERDESLLLIGLAFSVQETERVPMESHDRFLRFIITETGIIEAQEETHR